MRKPSKAGSPGGTPKDLPIRATGVRLRMEEAMCRIGAIKSKVPVQPSKALYLMLPQQEGHDNSGYAMVMQDLYGVFENDKDKPLLSLACTPRGAQTVRAYMDEKGTAGVAVRRNQ